MTPKKRTLLYEWEREMIAAFHDYRWKAALGTALREIPGLEGRPSFARRIERGAR